MLIKQVRSGSPAERAGLQSGDILVGMLDYETVAESHVRYVLNVQSTQSMERVPFHVVRDGRMWKGTLNLTR
jgi:S1-C subfamily serine protease